MSMLLLSVIACAGLAEASAFIDLKAECERAALPSLFRDDACFVATEKRFSTNDAAWASLHANCRHFDTDRRHLAHLRDPEHVRALQFSEVIQPEEKYFVGSRQRQPVCPRCCPSDRSQWVHVDERGQIHAPVNASLWLRRQPDDGGHVDLAERVVTLEPASRHDGSPTLSAFNDVDGSEQDIPLLCEYRVEDKKRVVDEPDFVEDPTGIVGLLRVDGTPAEARSKCLELGKRLNRSRAGVLPSIHSDQVNTYLADFAREQIQSKKWSVGLAEKFPNRFTHYWPVLIGNSWNGRGWKNDDGTRADYFLEVNYKSPNAGGGKHLFLMVRTNADTGFGTFGHWANMYAETDKIPFAFCSLNA